MHESTLKGSVLDVDNFTIKKSFSDLFIDNQKKRKYNDIIKASTKVTPKKKKLNCDNLDLTDSQNCNP